MSETPAPPRTPLIFGRHPSLWIGTLGAGLTLGSAIGLDGLSGPQVAALNAAIAAVMAAVWAWQVRPIAVPVFTGAAAALAGVAAAYGLHVPGETVGGVQALLIQVLTLLTYGQVSPAGAPPADPGPAPAWPEQAAAGGQQLAPGAHRPARQRPAPPPGGMAHY